MSKLGMIDKNGFTFFYGIEDIHHIMFMTASSFFDDENDIYANFYKPETVLIVIIFNNGFTYTYDSGKYTIYFE